jgi:signal transduction histidine kinase
VSGHLLARTFTLASIAFALCAPAPRALAQAPGRPARVLLIYQQQAESQPMVEFSEPLRQTIATELHGSVEFFQESLDFDRFSGREQSAPLMKYFEEKYRRFGIDVVVPVGGRALRFSLDRLRQVLPDVPIVFALCAEPQTNAASLPDNVTGRIASASRFAPTLWMARRLQPDAKQVVVIGGAGASDSASVSAATSAFAPLRDSLKLTVLHGLSLDALLPRLRELDPRSIVIFANYRQDGYGRRFEPLDVVGSIARAASAPMYTQLHSYVGEGVVGGSVLQFDDEGRRTGRLVASVLRRRPGERLPAVEPIDKSFVADWRQLRRFGLSETRLPPGSVLLYREPTAWERHRTVVLPTLGVIVAELLLIGGLLLERRRRKQAQKSADEQQRRADETRRQVTHMGRVALLGELATTISHELRQPLAAIRANAETGVKLVRRRGGTLSEDDRELCDEIFRAIADDDALASDIIARVRSLVRREELPQQPVDLNEVCRTSARLLQYDALTRRADIALSLDPRLPAVIGDPIQFQQVVLNLMLNALEASAACAAPRVELTTSARDDEVEVAVRDNGPGLPEEVRARLFESFFTTKAQGLGLGLAIVHSIVERHHGRIQAENGALGGAIFRVVVPRAPTAEDDALEARLMHREAEAQMSH